LHPHHWKFTVAPIALRPRLTLLAALRFAAGAQAQTAWRATDAKAGCAGPLTTLGIRIGHASVRVLNGGISGFSTNHGLVVQSLVMGNGDVGIAVSVGSAIGNAAFADPAGKTKGAGAVTGINAGL
jgi:hypothetical protein